MNKFIIILYVLSFGLIAYASEGFDPLVPLNNSQADRIKRNHQRKADKILINESLDKYLICVENKGGITSCQSKWLIANNISCTTVKTFNGAVQKGICKIERKD